MKPSICPITKAAAAALLLLLTTASYAQPDQLEQSISRLMRDGVVPGLSIAVVKDGRLAWQRGFGVKSAGTKEPVDDRTVFEAASLSKPVFAYAVLKMVEAGRLDLDAPLSKYLPAYIENDDRLNLITARIVLTHRTGFPNWRPAGKPLVIHFTPGEKFSYSGEGFVYLQKVVERLSGEPLDQFMKKMVFDPLRMTDSSYVWQERFESQAAVGHNTLGVAVGPRRLTEANAASSLITTAADYARFVIAVMNGAGLRKETFGGMLTRHVKVDESCVNCLGPKSARLSESLGWGLGWGIERTPQGDSFWHWGDNSVFRCFVAGIKNQKKAVVIFTNSINGLSIAPEIVERAIGGPRPAFAWIKYEPYNSPGKKLIKAIMTEGIDTALSRYSAARGEPSEALTESQMNGIGYQLLRTNKVKEAIEIFKLNVESFPNSSNVHDSLGEAYMVNGDKELAIKSYKKSVELNPQNTNAIDKLKKLEEK